MHKNEKSMERETAWLLREKYHGEKTEEFFADLERLKSGEPLGYVLGHIPFLNTTIYLDSHPLIPRPETEYWVKEALTELTDIDEKISVLDLCAGSGCIGLAARKALPLATVDFAERETKHHTTIRKNLKANGINEDQARIFDGDLFEEVTGIYDAILTNPPYIDRALDRTEASVKDYEPHEALYGGRDGFEYISRIVREASNYLKPHGVLYIEHEPEHEEAIRALSETYNSVAETRKDQYGIMRYTRITRKAHPLMAQ